MGLYAGRRAGRAGRFAGAARDGLQRAALTGPELDDLDEALGVHVRQGLVGVAEIAGAEEDPMLTYADPLLRAAAATFEDDDLHTATERVDHDHANRVMTCANALNMWWCGAASQARITTLRAMAFAALEGRVPADGALRSPPAVSLTDSF